MWLDDWEGNEGGVVRTPECGGFRPNKSRMGPVVPPRKQLSGSSRRKSTSVGHGNPFFEEVGMSEDF